VFSQPPDKRIIPFSLVANVSHIPEKDVEILVLKSFSTGLLKGRIDEVLFLFFFGRFFIYLFIFKIDRVVVIEDVKPRLLSFHQVDLLEKLVSNWKSKAEDALAFVNSQNDSLQ
jgi:hypothetical protein